MERICRFGMFKHNKCERCKREETTKHLLWECPESRKIWELFDIWKRNQASGSRNLVEYKDIFRVDDMQSKVN